MSVEEEASDHSVINIDLWVFVSLLLAAAVIHLKHRIPLPRSGLLLLVGVFLRCVGRYIGMLKDSVVFLDSIESETIMLIFLPALISECGFQTDWYTFKRELGQIVLLATSAVVVSTVLTAIVIRYVLGYDQEFGWYAALMLGAILSAPDHVAVVSQLKEVNADSRLETLIQGETLVNDGTVIVIFTTMMSGAIGSAADAGAVVELFFRLSLGGMALGLGFGLAVSVWLNRLVNQPVLETLLTLITTYLLFFTADGTSVHVSGALGTVTFGLYMSAYGKTLISPLVEKTLHNFWKMLGTCIESLTLILGGMLMGHFFVDFGTLNSSDIGALFGVFALLHLVRAIAVAIHWPLLRLMGYGCSFKEAIVLTFGALKGTISVALALSVYHNSAFSAKVQDLVLFWGVGVSALSVALDSMLLHFIVKVLGMESMTPVQENMLVSVTTSILESAKKQMSQLRENAEYSLTNWTQVLACSGPDMLLRDMVHATKAGKQLDIQGLSMAAVLEKFAKTVEISDHDITLETRRRFFTTLKGIYWEFFESGECFGNSALLLIESANRGLDQEEHEIEDWPWLERRIFPVRLLRFLHCAARIPLLGRLFRRLEYSYLVGAYDVTKNFIKAHKEAEELLDDMEIDIRKEVFEEVMREPQHQSALARHFLNEHIMDVYPEVYIFVQTKQVSSILLVSEQNSIEEAYDHGVITEIEYTELLKSVRRKILQLDRLSSPVIPTLFDLLRSCALFKDLSKERLQRLACSAHEELIQKGNSLFEESQAAKGLYVVLKGRVLEQGKGFEIEHGPGETVGLQHHLPHFSAPHTSARASVPSQVAFIPKEELLDLLQDARFELKMWFLGAKKLIVLAKEAFDALGQLDSSRLNVVFMNSTVEKLATGAEVPLDSGLMLLSGALSSGEHALCYVQGRDKAKASVEEACVVLRFNEDFGSFVRECEDLGAVVAKFELRGKGLKLGKKPEAGPHATHSEQTKGELLTSPEWLSSHRLQ